MKGGLIAVLQLREEDDVSDRACTRQQHAKAVYANADTTGTGHATLQSFDKVIVYLLSFFTGLVLKTLQLLNGVILLRVTGAKLLPVHNKLKYIHHLGVLRVSLGQRH